MNLFHAVILGVLAYIAWMFLNNDVQLPEEMPLSTWPSHIKEWHDKGQYTEIHGHQMFYIVKKCRNKELKNVPTFVIIHGFPSSSFEYHKVLHGLSEHGDVVLNDHIGFGFSDSPRENYTYSMGEAAENILSLWRFLELKKAHIVSHDMGDSVLTEILSRRHRGMLPNYFDNFFQSVTFTNGGMNIRLANLRITQKLSLYKSSAKLLNNLSGRLGIKEWVIGKQLRSIWSPGADPTVRDRDIEDLIFINKCKYAMYNLANSIYYLWDRYLFEYKWFDALRKLDIPSRFVWGDSDAVAPVAIPKSFEQMVPDFDLTLIENAGHFWMLEKPDVWVKEIIKILAKVK